MANQEQNFDFPFAKQVENAHAAVEENSLDSTLGAQAGPVNQVLEHMELVPLSRHPLQEPRIGFPIVSDEEDLSDEDCNEDGNEDGEFHFFGEVIQLSDDDDDVSDFSWESDSDSDDGNARQRILEVCGDLGACYIDVDNQFKIFYRFVEPDRQHSCNSAAAALKEPLSLLTKYRSQRGRSKYFRSAFSGRPNPLRRRRRCSPLVPLDAVQKSAVQRI